MSMRRRFSRVVWRTLAVVGVLQLSACCQTELRPGNESGTGLDMDSFGTTTLGMMTGTAGDAGTMGTGGGQDTPRIVGTPCESDADCPNLAAPQCIKVMSETTPGICTVSPCTPESCPVGSSCHVLNLPTVPSLCLPGSDDYCELHCTSSSLKCALDRGCLDNGCCGTAGGCPAVCSESTFEECANNALCDKSCCRPD